MGKTVKLIQMKRGQKGSILRIGGNGPISRRMRDMGLIPGASIQCEGRAPLGDPIEVKVLGYNLALRKTEAESIEVEISE